MRLQKEVRSWLHIMGFNFTFLEFHRLIHFREEEYLYDFYFAFRLFKISIIVKDRECN